MLTDYVSPYGGRVHKTLKNTGYYELSWWNPSTKRNESQREHKYVWLRTNEPIPAGQILHHKDGNKQNNLLSNLQLLSYKEHAEIHLVIHGLSKTDCTSMSEFHKMARKRDTERFRRYDRGKYLRIKADPARYARLMAYRDRRRTIETAQRKARRQSKLAVST